MDGTFSRVGNGMIEVKNITLDAMCVFVTLISHAVRFVYFVILTSYGINAMKDSLTRVNV